MLWLRCTECRRSPPSRGLFGSYAPTFTSSGGEGCAYRVGAAASHEHIRIYLVPVSIREAHNRELIPVRRGGRICSRPVQPVQVRRYGTDAARSPRHDLPRRHLRLCRSEGGPASPTWSQSMSSARQFECVCASPPGARSRPCRLSCRLSWNFR